MPEDLTSLSAPGGILSSLSRSDEKDAGAGTLRRRQWGRRAWVLAACAALVAASIGVGVWLWRWDHGLKLFSPGGNEVSGSIPIGRAVYSLAIDGNPLVDSITRQSVTVDLRTVRPHVEVNTAAATIRVLECQQNGRIVAVGAVRSLSYCRTVTPFAPGPKRFRVDLHSSALVLAITAHKRGQLRIAGIDVAYRAGARSGAQNTGLRMSYRAVSSDH